MEGDMYKLLENVNEHKIIGLYAALFFTAIPVAVMIMGYIFTAMVLVTAPNQI